MLVSHTREVFSFTHRAGDIEHTHTPCYMGSLLQTRREKILISPGVCVSVCVSVFRRQLYRVAAIAQLSQTAGVLIPDRLNLSVSPQ